MGRKVKKGERLRLDDIGDVARRAKISRSYLGRILRGKQIPSLPVACRLASIVGVPIEQIARLGGSCG